MSIDSCERKFCHTSKAQVFRPESYPEEGEMPRCARHGDGGTEAGWEKDGGGGQEV